MLDIKYIRDKPDEVKEFLINRNSDPAIVDRVLALDTMHRELKASLDQLKSSYNKVNKEIGMLKRGKIDVSKIKDHINNILNED